MAFIDCGTGHVDSNNIWAIYTVMNITGLISGLIMLVTPTEEVSVASKIWKTAVLTDKVIQKTEQGTWGASAHEEGYQIIKDTIYKIGGVR